MGKTRITTNAASLRTRLKAVKTAFEADMARAAQKVEAETLGMLVLGLNATIYATQPGAYRRTQDLLRGAHAKITLNKGGTFNVSVSNLESYAAEVEYGRPVPPGKAEARAKTEPLGASVDPLVTGRSGVAYTIPSYAHSRALVYGVYKLREEARASLKRAWAAQ